MAKEKENSNEVAKTSENAMAMFGGGKQMMSGVDLRIPQIQITHSAGLFVMPGGEAIDSFQAVIIDACNINAYWSIPFDQSGGGTVPDCWSLDGIMPDLNAPDVQSENCNDCQMNIFEKDGNGKKCKNKKRIHFWMDNATIPFRLTLPVMSCENFNIYGSTLVASGIPYQAVLTKVGLESAKNKTGIKYYKVTFKNIQSLDQEALQNIKVVWQQWLPIIRRESVGAEEEE